HRQRVRVGGGRLLAHVRAAHGSRAVLLGRQHVRPARHHRWLGLDAARGALMRALAAMLVVVLGCSDRDDYHQTHDPQPDAPVAPKPDAPGECVPACGVQTCGVDPVCGTSCGTCELGSHCTGGTCISDGMTCVPRTCMGACGTIDDGCGGQLDC